MRNGTRERQVGDLRIRIDPHLCVAFGDCIEAAPDAFRLDADDVVVFLDPERSEPSRLVAACAACPVDALTVIDSHGRQLVP